MKLYQTLDQALQEIEFNGIAINNNLGFTKDQRQREETFVLWLNSLAELLGWPENRDFISETARTYYELVKNAYKSGVEQHPDKRFSADLFKGNKGVVIGTTQQAGFLTKQQITLLEQGKPVPTIDGDGMGTQILLENANGLFISEKDMAIYTSRFY